MLNLSDQNITLVLTNLGTLILVDDGVVSIGRGVAKDGGDAGIRGHNVRLGSSDTRGRASQTTDGGGTGVDNDEVTPITESVVDANLVEGQGTRRESDTRVLGKVEGERDGEVATGTERVGATLGQGGTDGVGHGGNVTDHVTVSDTLGTRLAELEVKVEPVGLKLLNRQVVKGQGDLLKEVVHQIASPANGAVHVETSSVGVLELNLGDGATEPHVEDVVTRAVNGGRHVLLVKVNRARVAELNRDVREPVGFLKPSNEPGHSLGTTVEGTVKGVVGCQVDEADRGTCRRTH